MHPKFKRHFPRSYMMGTLIRRRQDPEYATEMLNEIGTTDMAIGDATAEIMITTPGKIPDVMYELDETKMDAITMADEHHEHENDRSDKSTHLSDGETGFVAHSTIFTILLIALLLLVLICCISACVIARARRKQANSSDECDPDCNGARQPLISSDKMSETTSKSSAASSRH